MQRRKFISHTVLLGTCIILPSLANAQVINIRDAINKSGRQRMLSQRLTKLYIQIGLDIEVEHSKKYLDTSMALYDRQLVELRAFSNSSENKATLSELEKIWQVYKQLLVGRLPNKSDGKILLVLSEDLLKLADVATTQLEKQADSDTGKLVNLAGRQRMLSQKIAKHFQAQLWEIAPPNNKQLLNSCRKEFVTAMGTLKTASVNTDKIKEELALTQQQWLFFESALEQSQDLKTHRLSSTNVATCSERILAVMDKVTGLYQQA